MKMLIGGQKVPASDGKTIDVYNPATGELIDTVPSATAEDVEKAIELAHQGQAVWARTPLHERCRILCKWADLIAENREQLAQTISMDTGKSIKDARAEMARIDASARSQAERAAHLYTPVLSDAQPGMEHDFFITKREPLGVIACVVPYNYPASLYTQKVAPALAMGNAVIIKPATDCPLTNILMTQLLLDAGVPGNVVQIVTGRGSTVGNLLASHPGIDMVCITGSTEAGISVAKAGAQNLTHMHLELGGNDAYVIFDDADLDAVTTDCVNARASNAGQTCAAPKRLLVHNAVKEQFTKMLVEKLSKIRVGDPMDPTMDVGSLITEKAALEAEEAVAHTVAQGASCIMGGKRYDKTFFPMTVLANVTKDMDIAKDLEIFGPVFPIIGFDTADEAIEIANQSRYGLAGGVATRDQKKAYYVATRMECGSVVIGGSGNYRPPELGFGGFKMSGIGREGVSTTLEEMSQVKSYILKGVR